MPRAVAWLRDSTSSVRSLGPRQTSHPFPLPLTVPPTPHLALFEQEFTSRDIRWKAEALLAMQEAAEYYLVGLFEDA